MRSLVLQIYLFSVLAVLVTLGSHLASWMVFAQARERDRDAIATSLIDDIVRATAHAEPGQLQLDHAHRRGPFEVALYTPTGELITSTHRPPPPAPDRATRDRLTRAEYVEIDDDVIARAVREGGQITALGVVRFKPPPVGPLIAPLLISLGVMLALAIVFARRLAAPLRRIADAARRFAGGEATARADLDRRDEIGAVARAFDEAADRVVMLMSSQQALMADVSHELRTPLARIRVALDLLIDGVEPQAAVELLPGVADDLTDLERLIDDIMTAARFDLSQAGEHPAGVPLHLEPTAGDALVEEAAARFRARCDTHPLRLELAPDLPTLTVDRVLVRRAIDNLLQNARRYSDPGRPIQLIVAPVADGVRITVVDEGIGMRPDEVERAFTPFYRGDESRSRATGGAGLGLALVQRVVEAHGGAIAIDSALGAGTRVAFTLPVAAA